MTIRIHIDRFSIMKWIYMDLATPSTSKQSISVSLTCGGTNYVAQAGHTKVLGYRSGTLHMTAEIGLQSEKMEFWNNLTSTVFHDRFPTT